MDLRDGENDAFNDKMKMAGHMRKFIERCSEEDTYDGRALVCHELFRFLSKADTSLLPEKIINIIEWKARGFYSDPLKRKFFEELGTKRYLISIFGKPKADEICLGKI